MNRIRILRKEKGLSQKELAEAVNVHQSAVSQWELGKTNPDMSTTLILADVFDVDTDYLLGRKEKTSKQTNKSDIFSYPNISPLETKRLPLLGEIACGMPIFAGDDRESYVEAGTNVEADFCLKAKGDSMINARIHDGDIVFIRKQDMVSNGEIAAVIIDNTTTLKRVYYYPNDSKFCLNAENPKYAPLMYFGEEINSIIILGKAVAFQSDII